MRGPAATATLLQVDVAVVTKTVTVHHAPALTAAPALVAALNAAHLDASLTPARRPIAVGRSWVPPTPILAAAALLVVSCVHYLHGPTGATGGRAACTTAGGQPGLIVPLSRRCRDLSSLAHQWDLCQASYVWISCAGCCEMRIPADIGT